MTVIPNTPLPEKFHRAFPTEADFQEALNIEVERRAGASRIEMLAMSEEGQARCLRRILGEKP